MHPQIVYPSSYPSSPVPLRPDGVIVGPKGMVDFTDARPDPETGLLCVIKEDFVDSLRKDPILKCDHLKVRQCHFTYITKFSSNQEEVCDENFEKICQIVFRQEAANQTARKCYKPMEVVCEDDKPKQTYPLPSYAFDNKLNVYLGGSNKNNNNNNNLGGGKEVCQTFYETVCTTKYRETHPGGGGKPVGDTRCEKVPRTLCGKPSCRVVQGPEECHKVNVAAITDVPEETCDLNPRTMCRLETRLVPRLEPVEDCRYRPRQVCHMDFDAPRKEKRPLKVKLCMKKGQTLPPPLPYVPRATPAPASYSPPPVSLAPSVPYYKPLPPPHGGNSVSSTYSASTLSTLNVV